ncbi:DNA replication licensing factor mcm10 [Cyphellophora attinorum]|uniref:DNA replication licensing factor mcm10 n=1 Tax=Cyphellophora attinorum TaxID=1664694 RepID=A0A0N0NMN9_9EURO|nr:DNA replication licensing factor mcm10 [Phialophora attinorum]KPI40429.1 DNA replication licensing factor mcm10 [Phialophora attinorum]
MSEDIPWPPTSPKAALLSSPSGRKRYSEAMDRSPIKRSRTTPNLLSRLQDARSGGQDENMPDSDEEDDEETLKLQLAAIEAKLKLKRLQQAKAKPESTQHASSSRRTETVQIGLSPTKRAPISLEPRSPSRLLLGIDKGKTGADMSLKRAKSLSDRPGTSTALVRPERSLSRASQLSSRLQSAASRPSSQTSSATPAPKSFSERMADVRDKDKGREIRRSAALENRTSNFNLDKDEMEEYRALAEENQKAMSPPVRNAMTQSYTREEILQAQSAAGGSKLRRSKTDPDLKSRRPVSRSSDSHEPDSSLHEGFSGISLSSRILPHTFLKRTLPEDDFTVYTVAELLRNIKSPEYELPDGVGDYVVFAIIASKSSPLDQKIKAEETSSGTKDWERKWDDGKQNAKKFIAMTLTDLKWTVDLYLFGTAVPRYHRLTPGTVIAILNPGIMPPKKGREESGAFSLNLSNGEDTILEIGTAAHLGHCTSKKKDGKLCGQWIDTSKTEICEWHLNMQLHRTEQGRMGLNAGSHGYGQGSKSGSSGFPRFNQSDRRGGRSGRGRGGGLLPRDEGQKFDELGQSYFVSRGTAPIAPPTMSDINTPFTTINTARTIDLDDPFLNADHVRDRKTLMKKRAERQQQEREIAKHLGKTSYGSSAGAEYMRHQSGTATKKEMTGREGVGVRRDAQAILGSIMRDAGDGKSKRTGDEVRLSPAKREKKKVTRFVTDRGIREAGRESSGVVPAINEDDDDDDDLDIV